MAVLKCKMCGGDLNIEDGAKFAECEYCGSAQTIPEGDSEKKTNLFNRANRLRMSNEFDKAAGVYESLVAEFPEESEGYWGLVLCTFGIEYVDDANTGKKIPTCHRTLFSSVMDDENFIQAYENADAVAKNLLREEAKEIDRLQRKIIAVAEKEEPYDVFICYKEIDDITKQRTEDSLIAQDIYTELIKEGYKVFFSRITLRDKAGTEYEPYIYSALSSAKVMLAIGTKFEYYDAVWVKNEWSRYVAMMSNDSSKHLLPCYKNLDAYDIPKEFKNLQALDMGEVTFFKNLTDNIEKIIPKQTQQIVKVSEKVSDGNSVTVDSLLKRAFMFLEEENWTSADEYCERALDIDPECGLAYLGKLMIDLKVKKREELSNLYEPFDNKLNYQKAVRFADKNLAEFLSELEFASKIYRAKIDRLRIEERRRVLEEENEKRKRQIKISQKTKQNRKFAGLISVNLSHTVGVKSDGTVVACGDNNVGLCNVGDWRDVISISTAADKTIGIKSDGTVVACGKNDYGQCDVDNWKDIIAISLGARNIVGLKSDGTVIACGKNDYGQCNTGDWKDIIAIFAYSSYTVGLKSDGTVVTCGKNDYGQCGIEDWKDIIAISLGYTNVVGLKWNGDVIACGKNDYGQCDVGDWEDIMAISIGDYHTVGLKMDGTVVACGKNDYGQCDVGDWKEIIGISTGNGYTVGLKMDGTVVACGKNDYGQCDVGDWKSIIAISIGGGYTLGLKSDGTIVTCGGSRFYQRDVKDWKLFDNYENFEQERKIKCEQRREEDKIKERQMQQFRAYGLCQHCGGTFKGIFEKSCSVCGRKKDY